MLFTTQQLLSAQQQLSASWALSYSKAASWTWPKPRGCQQGVALGMWKTCLQASLPQLPTHILHIRLNEACSQSATHRSIIPGGACCGHQIDAHNILSLQVTGKKTDDKDTGSFLPEDFKTGEYEAAVKLEKQDDLKTASDHLLTQVNMAPGKQKHEAEVGSWILYLGFYHLYTLSSELHEVLPQISKLEIHAC